MFGIKRLTNDEYAISANAILGIRDSGKTYTATKAAEELYDAGIPFIALDPIGVWGSLRVPGKGKGYPVVVAGGRRGDLPLTVKNAGPIVRAAMEAGVSLVIDLFSRELSKADWRRIVRDTVEVLLHENEEFGLRHVFIEEAAEFVPQRVQDGQVFAAVEKLVRMGGNSKLGCTLINQRSADLNKSVLELCANVFVHRQKGKNTLLDLRKWFDMLELTAGEQIDIGMSLPNLPSGECWALLEGMKSPLLVKISAKNSQHPDRRAVVAKGDVKRQPVPATAFVKEMQEKLAEKDKPAAKLPVVLIKGPKSNVPDSGALDRVENKGWREGQESVRAQIPKLLDAQHAVSFQMGVDWCRGAAIIAAKAIPNAELIPSRKSSQEIRTLTSQHTPPGPASSAPLPPSNYRQAPSKAPSPPSSGLTGPQAALLRVLAWWREMGHQRPTRAQVAAVAGWKATAGHLNNVSGQLRSAGLIEYPEPGRFALTEPGANVAPEPDMGVTLLDGLRSTLSGPQKTVLETMLGRRRQSRHELCEQVGWNPSAGHVNNVLGQMRSMEIIDYPARGEVELQEWVQ